MIGDISAHVAGVLLSRWQLSLGVALLSILAFTYLITTILFYRRRQETEDGQEPPTVPYCVPFIGNVFSFVTDTRGFLAKTSRRAANLVPYTLKLGPFKAYIVQQPEYIAQVLNAGRTLTSTPFLATSMGQVFGTPRHLIPFYEADNSGVGRAPWPGTKVPEHQRVWSHHHHYANVYLNGENLRYLATRFAENLSASLAATDPNLPMDGGDWAELPDFYMWWRKRVFRASVNTMFGPHLLRIYPGLEEDFWIYHRGFMDMLKFWPRWLYPAPYDALDRILDGLMKWHAFAKEHSDPHVVPADGKEPAENEFWGSAWFRARYRWGENTKVLDARALAGEDLGMLLAANANLIPMTFWYLVHTFSDRELAGSVRGELQQAIGDATPSVPLRFDVDRVLTSPLLQSIFAEVLRLYASIVLIRMNDSPTPEDFRMGPWKLDRKGMIIITTASPHYDEQAWGPQRTDNGRQTLSKFWAGRFLVPEPAALKARDVGGAAETDEKAGKVKFSVDKLAGTWIPFSAGFQMCPGRHLAKQEIIGSAAVFSAYFDLEVLDKVPGIDHHFYGMGSQPPKEPCRVRIRRRVGMATSRA